MSKESHQGKVAYDRGLYERVRDFWMLENLEHIFLEEGDRVRELKEGEILEGGHFLEKLWSAIDFLIREKYGTPSKSMQDDLGSFYYGIFHGRSDAHEKAVMARELQNFMAREGFEYDKMSPDAIDGYAEENEKFAIRELGKLKKAMPPFWVKRKEDFSSELKLEEIPPHTARATLEDYRRLVHKHEVPTTRG